MKADIVKGATGVIATGGGVAISLSQVNGVLTTISLVIGIAVGLASLISIARKRKKDL